MIRIDFLSKLPLEISVHILSYCSGNDLISCCLVSRNWKNIVDNAFLWKKYCAQRNFKPLSARKIKSWKEVFNENIELQSNWRNSNCLPFDLTSEGKVIRKACSDDFNLVLAVGSMLSSKPTELDIYQVKKNSIQKRQNIQFSDSLYTFLEIATFGDFIAVQFSTFVLIYKCFKKDFILYYSFHWLNGEFQVSYLSPWTDDRMDYYPNYYSRWTYTFMVIVENILYVYIHRIDKLIIWNLEDKTLLHSIPVHAGLCKFFNHGVEVFVFSGESHFNSFINGNLVKRFDVDGNLMLITCNHSSVVASCHDETVYVWERKSGLLKYTNIIDVPYGAVLHPFREVMIYPLYSRKTKSDQIQSIKAVSLKDNRILWESSMRVARFNRPRRDLYVVCDSFVLLYSPDPISEDRVRVYDIETGNRITQFPLDNDIISISDKFILLGENRDFMFDIKFLISHLHLYYV